MVKASRIGLQEQLRQLILATGWTQYRLSQESGVDRSQLSRFLRGKRDLSLAVADKVCAVLGINFVQDGTGGAAQSEPPARPRKAK
jgi:transcriptional regulator with XRE-family HTH domain